MSYMSNFTPRVQQVLNLARSEADRLNHNFVGTEHVLLGLIALGQGVAVNVLAKLGLNLENVRQEIEKGIGTGNDRIKSGTTPPYTPRVVAVLELAQRERARLNHTYLGTEHLLLGLLREGESVAAKIMRDLGIDPSEVRAEILREFDRGFSPKPASATPVEKPQAAKPCNPKPEAIDTNKRYDIYCTERNAELVVYRNALFKGAKKMFQSHQYDSTPVFFELELADGQTIFISRFSVIKFCEPGGTPGGEKISPAIS